MFGSPLSRSPYEVLGVATSVDADDLRRAHRRRLRETHPDTGGDQAEFQQVQRAWELIGTAEARAAYDRGRATATMAPPTFSPRGPGAPTDPSAGRRPDTRPRARAQGHPGGLRREQYLRAIRQWVGLGDPLEDPYDPALVRSAPREIRQLIADALAEEETARSISELGMGYSVWHDVDGSGRHPEPEQKIDHVVLAPSGLYGVMSADFGEAVRVRRNELIGDGVEGAPVADLLARMRRLGRQAGARFSGAIVVLPDDDVPGPITELGRVKGQPVAIVGHSALQTVLRRGVQGARDIGGNELFDVRTRLDAGIRFV